jgi:hypothetical protein
MCRGLIAVGSLSVLLMMMTGCGGMAIENYRGSEPALTLEEYFDGKTRAWGLFQDRFGTVRRQFVVDIDGVWDGKTLTLTEDFTYDDRETETRIWRLTKIGDGRYEGRSDDVVGTAIVRTEGKAAHLSYLIDLKIGDGKQRLRFDDWMFQQDDDSLINRATVSKFGIRVGEVTLFFQRVKERIADQVPEALATAAQ